MSGFQGYTPITIVNVSQQQGPTPLVLQRTGALVSQGATTLTSGTYSLLTAPASITSLLKGAAGLASLTWASSVATATASAAHGITVGDTVPITLSGQTPTGYSGTFLATATTTTAFTYPLATNPGTATVPGSYTLEDVSELQQMVNTYFANGSANAVYVLELGIGNATDGISALQAFITAQPLIMYRYLLPRSWGVLAAFYSSFLPLYNGTTAKVYFHATTTTTFQAANTGLFATTLKDGIITVEAPAVVAAAAAGTGTEFSAAGPFYQYLNLNPSPANQVCQAQYGFVYGVTAYPTKGNQTLFATLKAANINYIGTGAEGGIGTAIVFGGCCLDGNDINRYWYAVDNVELNLDQLTSNAVINGSNNPQNPLNYNQQGINTLQGVASAVMQMEVSYSLALGQVVLTQLTGPAFATAISQGAYAGQIVINAIPFLSYVQTNQSDYTVGLYQGLEVAFVVQNGFDKIIYSVTVANFVN